MVQHVAANTYLLIGDGVDPTRRGIAQNHHRWSTVLVSPCWFRWLLLKKLDFFGYRHLDHHRCHHCIMTQAGHKRDGLPMALRHMARNESDRLNCSDASLSARELTYCFLRLGNLAAWTL
jgi:hypothetical protein